MSLCKFKSNTIFFFVTFKTRIYLSTYIDSQPQPTCRPSILRWLLWAPINKYANSLKDDSQFSNNIFCILKTFRK